MTELDDLAVAIKRRSRDIDSLAAEARVMLSQQTAIEAEVEELTKAMAELERVAILFNSLGEERQIKAQQTIEGIVTRGLQMIFDDTLSFHILQGVRAKSAVVEFIVRTTLPGGQVVDTGVLDARGGGLAATIGFLLRLTVMLLQKDPREDNILVLDETFAMVSAEYLEPLGQFLREIVDKTGVQIVMVTHQPEFAEYADRVYRFSTKDGKTQVAKDA
jgi:DNA repair exonuclease SbcCD ATPase subunit